MAQTSTLVCKILASSVSIARKAGEIIRDIQKNNNLHTVDKGNNDFQTEADVSAQRCIVASLKKLYPNVHIVAEEVDQNSLNLDVPEDWLIEDSDKEISKLECPESLSNVTADQVTIWIDPLDGTSEFSKGQVNHVTTLIGICVDDDAVAGVIYQPFWQDNGRAVWGLVGSGIGGLEVKEPPQNLTYVTSRNHSNETIETFIKHLQPSEIIKVGGAGNKVLYLLEGKAHAYVYPIAGCRRWDTAGPEAVLRAAGGVLSDAYGKKYIYNKDNEKDSLNRNGVIATAPAFNHAEFIKRINEIQSKINENNFIQQ